MQKPVPVELAIPGKGTGSPYPVVYLLHGYSGDAAVWSELLDLDTLAQRHGLFLISVDGGFNSWYWDSPEQREYRYETFLAKELPGFLDSAYIGRADSRRLAVTGFSMGGSGALHLASRHPDLVAAVGAISGVLDISEYPENWDMAFHLGPYGKFPERWRAHGFLHTMENLTGKEIPILLTVGLQDFVLAGNRRARKKMQALGIKHEYVESEGRHGYSFAVEALPQHLEFFSKQLGAAK